MNRRMRTRMSGGVGSEGEKPSLTRLKRVQSRTTNHQTGQTTSNQTAPTSENKHRTVTAPTSENNGTNHK